MGARHVAVAYTLRLDKLDRIGVQRWILVEERWTVLCLKVQMGEGGVAGVSAASDRLTRHDVLPFGDDNAAGLQVGEHYVAPSTGFDADTVAGEGFPIHLPDGHVRPLTDHLGDTAADGGPRERAKTQRRCVTAGPPRGGAPAPSRALMQPPQAAL